MDRQKKWPIIAGAAALAAIVVAVMWVSVFGGLGKAEPGESAPMHAEHPAPEDTHAQIAAQAALVQGFTWTPSEDTSDLDGFIRSDAVTENLRETLQSAAEVQPPQALPENWEGWARSGDVVRAVVSPEDMTESEGAAEVVATVMQRVVHPDGDTTPLTPFEVTATVVYDANAAKWLLDAYEVTSVG